MAEFTKPKRFTNLTAISPIDGRFRGNIQEYSDIFSEQATMKYRVKIEIEYLIALSKELNQIRISKSQESKLRSIYENFSDKDAKWLENKDLEINHDTKTAEYLIQKKLKELDMEHLINWIHFGLTSADIDSNVLVLSIQNYEEKASNARKQILKNIKTFSKTNLDSIFLARTHGKKAVPTTMSKEFNNFYNRLKKIDKQLEKFQFEGKLAGAVGNWNAMLISFPDNDWNSFCNKFIQDLGLKPNSYVTQILPYDNISQYLDLVKLFNLILIDMSRDIWRYISDDLLILKINKAEVGSSTMAHKVNPISFEGCEANLLFSNGGIDTLVSNLTNNRLQRDLTDKYMARFIGEMLVISSLGYSMIEAGLRQVQFNSDLAEDELNNHWECLSEAVQTILRRDGYANAYEKIKDLTRGKSQCKEDYISMIKNLRGIPEDTRNQLLELTPSVYIGWAKEL